MREWIRKRLVGNEKGFTLVEMMVVVAIIGVLATVLVPQTMGALDKARDKQGVATATRVVTAIELLRLEDEDGLDGLTDSNLFTELDLEFTEDEKGNLFVGAKSDLKPGKVFVNIDNANGKLSVYANDPDGDAFKEYTITVVSE